MNARLPQLEMDCMSVLWRQSAATVAQVRSALPRALAYTTVMTVLDRMASKGVVTRRKNGRAYLYSAVLDRETARRAAVERLLASLFENDRAALVEYLARPAQRTSRSAAAAPASAPVRSRKVGRGEKPAEKPSFSPSHIDESLL
ncbi:MAG TPA: BlaI/MecI/CopY family transcriptional regulator [Terriglobales bacterium]|nr:BlaI/MecI/CopY family transcriptional regulator [Terriglobales bacterium]